jgi:phosphoribosylanthranilate isomerase
MICAIRPDALQISHPFSRGQAPGVRIIRVIQPGITPRYDCEAVIVDASHGRGRTFDPGFARTVVSGSPVPVILAGGLNPDNVAAAIREIRPYGVDVSTGVELRPGVKDPERIRAFLLASRYENAE